MQNEEKGIIEKPIKELEKSSGLLKQLQPIF